MLQAGLAAERGYNTWQRRRGIIKTEPPLIEPMFGVRQALFSLNGPKEDGSDFGANLLSLFRVFCDAPVAYQDGLLTWPVLEPKPSKFTLAAGFPIQLNAEQNLTQIVLDSAMGLNEVRYIPTTAGNCVARVVFGVPNVRLPKGVQPPRYSEPSQ
jgi:hypothetical protein